jgi:hypothetical protein
MKNYTVQYIPMKTNFPISFYFCSIMQELR